MSNKTLEVRQVWAVRCNERGTVRRLCEWKETAERLCNFPYERVTECEVLYNPDDGRYYTPEAILSPDRVDREERSANAAKAVLKQRLEAAGFDLKEVREILLK